MQILSFFMFVVMAGFIILVVGYGLSLLEGRGERTRCRMPHKDNETGHDHEHEERKYLHEIRPSRAL